MKKTYQVFLVHDIEIEVEAESQEEAEKIALYKWYESAKYGGELEVDDIYCIDE